MHTQIRRDQKRACRLSLLSNDVAIGRRGGGVALRAAGSRVRVRLTHGGLLRGVEAGHPSCQGPQWRNYISKNRKLLEIKRKNGSWKEKEEENMAK